MSGNQQTTATTGGSDRAAIDWAQQRYDDALHAELGRLRLERDLWRELAEARSGILVAYRVGGRVPGKHIDNARRAERLLSEMEADRA